MTAQTTITLTKQYLTDILQDQRKAFESKNLGVEREVLSKLKPAINSPFVNIITGLRRVGKSTLLAQIAAKYFKSGYFFVNFEDDRLVSFQVTDFDLLHEVLIELYGKQKVFLFDEIQNVPQWERFIRRLHDFEYKCVATGSNASLLGRELGTRLTGRYLPVELYPFSFREFLTYKKADIPNKSEVLVTSERGQIAKLLREYIKKGGIPDALKYPETDPLGNLLSSVLYRDVAARYQLVNVRNLKEMVVILAGNVSALISFNKLKDALQVGNVSTIKNYIDYLEDGWLFFTLNKFAFSVKEQQIAAKKVYCIDTGLATSIGFSFSDNRGRLIENLVYLSLRKKHDRLFYYKTKGGFEVDFFVQKENMFVQVAESLELPEVLERETRALAEAAKEQKAPAKLIIVTESEKRVIEQDGLKIQVVPLYEWLLHGSS